jgi:hypothetical protein
MVHPILVGWFNATGQIVFLEQENTEFVPFCSNFLVGHWILVSLESNALMMI